jgi:hypothetical protein
MISERKKTLNVCLTLKIKCKGNATHTGLGHRRFETLISCICQLRERSVEATSVGQILFSTGMSTKILVFKNFLAQNTQKSKYKMTQPFKETSEGSLEDP